MSINGTQELTVTNGGIGPFTWSITGGGGTLSSSSGTSVNYTAPSSNQSCANNPTIKVTDYCGQEATLKLAVNSYSGGETA
jgi:hypothetical protein